MTQRRAERLERNGNGSAAFAGGAFRSERAALLIEAAVDGNRSPSVPQCCTSMRYSRRRSGEVTSSTVAVRFVGIAATSASGAQLLASFRNSTRYDLLDIAANWKRTDEASGAK